MKGDVFEMKRRLEAVLRDTFSRRELEILDKNDEFQSAKNAAQSERDFPKVVEVGFKVLSKQKSHPSDPRPGIGLNTP